MMAHIEERVGPRRLAFTPAVRLLKAVAVVMVVVLLCVGADLLFRAIRPPGTAIRDDLTAAAAELYVLPPAESGAAVRQSLLRYFSERYPATVATSSYPVSVAVTLHGVDKTTCLGAIASARRIEGLVVVQLEGYEAAPDCHADNDMTWSLMP